MNGIQFIVSQMRDAQLPPRNRVEMRQRAAELLATMSQREAAMELGVSRSTVCNLLREWQSQDGAT